MIWLLRHFGLVDGIGLFQMPRGRLINWLSGSWSWGENKRNDSLEDKKFYSEHP